MPVRRIVVRIVRALQIGNWGARVRRIGVRRALLGSLLAGGVSQAVLVLSGVLVARALGPEDRGYMALVLLVPSVIALVGSLGLPLALTYFVARSPASARSIGTKLIVPGVLQAAIGVVLTLVALVTVLSGEPARVTSAGLVATALVPALLAQTYGLSMLQGQQRFLAFNALRVAPAFLYSIAVLGAFLTGFHSLFQLTLVTSAANLLAAGLIVAVLLRGLGRRDVATAEVPSISQMTRFGLKGLVGSVSPVENFRLDQAVVALFLSPVSLGYYVVAQAFINFPRFVAQSVGLIAYPSVAAHRDRRAAARSLWRHFALGTALTLGAVTILEIAVPTLVSVFFGAAFSEVVPIARILLVGALFVSARRVLADGVRGAGYPSLGSIAEATSWVVMLPAMLVLAPSLGSEGVALAVTLGWAASLGILLAATVFVVHGQGKPRGPVFAGLVEWHSGRDPRWLTLVLPTLATSVLAAGVAVFLPPYASLGFAVVLGLLVAAGLLRRQFSQRLPRPTPGAEGATVTRQIPAASSRPDDDDFRLARILYYAGFVTLGQLTLRYAAVGTLSDLLFFFSFASAASLLAIYRRQVAIPLPPLLIYGLLIFSLGALASTFSSLAPNASIAVVVRLVVLTTAWFWVGTIVLRRPRHIVTAAALWVASAALNGIGAIAQLSIDPNIIPGGYVHWGRVTSFTANVNDLGGIAACALIPALMLGMRRSRNSVYTLAAYAGLLLSATGLVLSGSIGALIAAAVGALLWIAATPRLPARAFVFFCVALVGALSLLHFQESKDAPTAPARFERVTGAPTDPNATLWSRVETYRVAIDRIRANPFTGVGLDSESSTIGTTEPHNLVIGLWFKAGFFGLAGVLLVLGAIFSAARATLRDASSVDEQMLALALLCSFLAFIVFSMSGPVLYTRYGWAPAALLLALRAVQKRRMAPHSLGVHPPRADLVPAGVLSLAQRRRAKAV
jgi:O-antigen/teichoic acid export membrane protein/O-antigen ligase